MQAAQLRLKHEEAEEEAKKQQTEARRLAVRNKDLESRSQVPRHPQKLLHDAALCFTAAPLSSVGRSLRTDPPPTPTPPATCWLGGGHLQKGCCFGP